MGQLGAGTWRALSVLTALVCVGLVGVSPLVACAGASVTGPANGGVHALIASVDSLAASAADSALLAVLGLAPGGDGTTVLDGRFDQGFSNYPVVFGGCSSLTNSSAEAFNLRTSCDPGNDGLYRTDMSTATSVYPAGVPECTTIPVELPNGIPGVPDTTFVQFAEELSYRGSRPGWGMELTSFFDGNTARAPNRWAIAFSEYRGQSDQLGAPAWVSSQKADTGWHTLSVCTNSANSINAASGAVYGIWLDGIRQTFTYGRCAGQLSCGGFPIITTDATSWPLDINDYTGGSPVPNTIIHGAPLVATRGPNGLPPEPPGGWTSP